MHGFACFLYFTLVLTPRWPKKYNALFVLLSSALFYTLPTYISGVQNNVFEGLPFKLRVSFLVSGGIIFFSVLFCYKNKLLQKLLHLIVQFLIFIVTDMTCSIIVSAITGTESLYTMSPYAYLLAKLIFTMLAFPITGLVALVFKRQKFPLAPRQMAVLAIFVALETIMIFNTVYTQNSQFDDGYFVWLSIELLLCVVSDVLVLHMLKTTAEKEELEKQLTLSQLQSVHTRQIEEDNAQLRMLRHDVKNTLTTAEILLQKGETAQAERFLHDFHTSIDRESKTAYCQNAIVNSVLLLKAQQAKKAGFHLKCDVFCPHEIAIDAFDLCSLFSNLLDNAIDHADRSQSSELLISAWQNKNDYVIRCQNRFAPEHTVRNRLGKTNQGLGLSIIKKTVKKYDGTMDIQKDENFTITLWLKAGSAENA